jgi:hypothetical protein
MALLARVATALVGLALMLFGFYSAHIEQLKVPNSSTMTIMWVAVGALGGLLLPFVGGKMAEAGKTGITLVGFGRREASGEVDLTSKVLVTKDEVP